MGDLANLALARQRFKEAMTIFSQKQIEYRESNSKCVAGQIRLELWRLELAKAKEAVKQLWRRKAPREAAPYIGGLPIDILTAIFSLLPVDERLRCESVCYGWQQILRQPVLWERLDLSSVKGKGERVTDDVLLDLALRTWETTGTGKEMEQAFWEWKKTGQAHASDKFGFGLKRLDLSGCSSLSVEMIMAVVHKSSDLQELVALSCKRFDMRNFTELNPDIAVVADAELLVPASSDVELMGHLLRRASPGFQNVCLRELYVVGRDLSIDEMRLLANGLRKNRSITSLRLTYCGLQAEHMELLEQALIANSIIIELGLSGNDEMGTQGITALQRLLANPVCCLKYLSLDSCFMEDAHYHVLHEAIVSSPHLARLDLSYNDLTRAMATQLRALLQATTSLTELRLASNWLTGPGVADLAEGLATNTSLSKLDLKGNGMGLGGARGLAAALRQNTTLRTLYAHHANGTGVLGALCLVEALQTNRGITSLKLEVGAGSLETGEAVLRALQSSPALQILTVALCGNDVSEGLARLLAQALRDHGSRLAVSRCCPCPPPGIRPGHMDAHELDALAWRAKRRRTWHSVVAMTKNYRGTALLLGLGVACGVAIWYLRPRMPGAFLRLEGASCQLLGPSRGGAVEVE